LGHIGTPIEEQREFEERGKRKNPKMGCRNVKHTNCKGTAGTWGKTIKPITPMLERGLYIGDMGVARGEGKEPNQDSLFIVGAKRGKEYER